MHFRWAERGQFEVVFVGQRRAPEEEATKSVTVKLFPKILRFSCRGSRGGVSTRAFFYAPGLAVYDAVNFRFWPSIRRFCFCRAHCLFSLTQKPSAPCHTAPNFPQAMHA